LVIDGLLKFNVIYSNTNNCQKIGKHNESNFWNKHWKQTSNSQQVKGYWQAMKLMEVQVGIGLLV